MGARLRIDMRAHIAFCRMLVKLGFIDSTDADGFVYNHHFPAQHFASKCGFDEGDCLRRLASELHLETVVIKKQSTDAIMALLKSHPADYIPLADWKEIKSVPIELTSSGLRVAMANPLDREARSLLEFALGVKIQVVLAKEHEILSAISTQETSEVVSGLIECPIAEGFNPRFSAQAAEPEAEQGTADASAPPVVKLVGQIISDAIFRRASDIHLDPCRDKLTFRIRVDGIIQELLTIPRHLQFGIVSRIKLLSRMDIAERRRPQDGRMRVNAPSGSYDLRVSSIPTIFGEALVARILPNENRINGFDTLGMEPQTEVAFKKALAASSKVVLVTGPTGSGKTSTLYSALSYLNSGSVSIVSIEDPVEYNMPEMNQIEVNTKIGVTFAQGLRAVLRQDPDVIMVGEIRDAETAQIALRAAQTGHLILSTIHTETAVSAVTRLSDLGMPAYMISASLGAVLTQRLVRCLCQNCAVPVSGKELERCLELRLDPAGRRQATGCAECDGTGYDGRRAIYSFLSIDDRLREAIREGRTEHEIERMAVEAGHMRLGDAALRTWSNGITSLAEIERVLGPLDRTEFLRLPGVEIKARRRRGGLKIANSENVTLDTEPTYQA